VVSLVTITAHSWLGLRSALAFTSTNTNVHTNTNTNLNTNTNCRNYDNGNLSLYAYGGSRLRTNVEIPLLDLIDQTILKDYDKKDDNNNNNNDDDGDDENQKPVFVVPLPSSDLPDQLATPFLYGMQMDTPLHKMILQEAISMAEATAAGGGDSTTTTTTTTTPLFALPKPFYGHLVWKDGDSNSLVGAIGCTAEILVNAPTTEIMGGGVDIGGIGVGVGNAVEDELAKLEKTFSDSKGDQEDEATTNKEKSNDVNANATPASNTLLCRGGWRFVVKEVVRSIPFPVVIVDEIQDDADEDDSDMFSTVGSTTSEDDDHDDDHDHDDHDELRTMATPELIGNTMQNVQSIIGQRLEDAIAETKLGPLEKSILEAAKAEGGGNPINPAAIELAVAEEMTAVWEVFQHSLVDDIEPSQRRFAVAIMAAELADLDNNIRKEILLTRDSEDRLRIVLRELKEIVGMAQARKLAATITDEADESEKDLRVGKPQLPPWAKQIKKGTKIEYFWNEEWGWCSGEVAEDPVTIVDELLLTIRFDDGEKHQLPLSGEDKLRWRPGGTGST